MHFGMQRFDAPVHDLGKPRVIRDFLTARPASRNALAVPPVDKISTPSRIAKIL